MILPSLAFIWPFLLIVAAGWFLAWVLDAKARYLFDYRKRHKTYHASDEWKNGARAKARWHHLRRCCFCGWGGGGLHGHFRDYRRMGRASGWRDVTTLCGDCHTAVPKSDGLPPKLMTLVNEPLPPVPEHVAGFSARTVRKAYTRDRCCRGCSSRRDLKIHRRTDPPRWWWERWRDWRNCYLWCPVCLANLKRKSGWQLARKKKSF